MSLSEFQNVMIIRNHCNDHIATLGMNGFVQKTAALEPNLICLVLLYVCDNSK